jgi:hypothetical protein
MRKSFLFTGIFLCFAFLGCQDNKESIAVSLKKFNFKDSSNKTNVDISFTYPIVMLDSVALVELQKNFIKQAFGEEYANLEPSIIAKHYAEKFKFDEPCNDGNYELLMSDSAYFPITNILQYITKHYEFTCGANGLFQTNGYIYNILDGKKIELKDIFKNDWEQNLTKLLIKELSNKYKDTLSSQDEKKFIPSGERLRLKTDGLVFFYPVYSIGPRSIGEPHVFLSWSALKPYLNKKSVLYQKL